MIEVNWKNENGKQQNIFNNRDEYLAAYFGTPHSYEILSVNEIDMNREFENIAYVAIELELPKRAQFYSFLTQKLHKDFNPELINNPLEIMEKETAKMECYNEVAKIEATKHFPNAKSFWIKWVTVFLNQETYEKFIETDQLSVLNDK